LNAKGAFFHSALHPGPVSEVVNRRVYFFLWDVWLCPVEDPPFVRTCSNAVPASNTPVVINDDDTIRFLPGGMDRTNLHARRLLTLLTLNGEIDKTLFRYDIRIVIVFRVFEIDQVSSLKPEHPDPLKLRVMSRMIILFHTGIDASSATNASGKLQAVCPKGIGNGPLGADLKFPPVLLLVSLFQLCNDTFLFFLRHFTEMFLQKVLSFLLRAGGEERKRKTC
jgi:hypothetical protein